MINEMTDDELNDQEFYRKHTSNVVRIPEFSRKTAYDLLHKLETTFKLGV